MQSTHAHRCQTSNGKRQDCKQTMEMDNYREAWFSEVERLYQQDRIRHASVSFWSSVSTNPNLTLSMVLRRGDVAWDYPMLSKNPSIRWNDMIENRHLPWKWSFALQKADFQWRQAVVFSVCTEDRSLWQLLTKHMLDRLSSLEFVRVVLEEFPTRPWDFTLCAPKNVDMLEALLDKNWKFSLITSLSWIDCALIATYPTKSWAWHLLSSKQDFSWNLLKRFPHKPWDLESSLICHSPDLCWEFVLQYRSKNWNWYFLSQRQDLTWEFVQQHDTLPWNWYVLSESLPLSWEIVRQFPEAPWHRYSLLSNPMRRGQQDHDRQRVLAYWRGHVLPELLAVVLHPDRYPTFLSLQL